MLLITNQYINIKKFKLQFLAFSVCLLSLFSACSEDDTSTMGKVDTELNTETLSEFVEVSTSDNLYIVTLDDNAIERSELSATIDDLLTTSGIAKDNHIYTYSSIMYGFSVKSISNEQLVALQANTLVVGVDKDEFSSLNDETIPESIAMKRSINVPDLTPSLKSIDKAAHVYVMGTSIDATHNEFSHTTIDERDFAGGYGTDCNGHATFTASLIAGKSLGPAPNVSLHSVRHLNCIGAGSLSSYMYALNYIYADVSRNNWHKTIVFTMNVTMSSLSFSVSNAAYRLINDLDILMVAGAGNRNQELRAGMYAGEVIDHPNFICVGALKPNSFSKAGYSNGDL